MANNKGPGDWDWDELDWLEEMPLDDVSPEPSRPAPRSAQRRSTQPSAPQQRPVQQQRPAQQQRAPQQRQPQQRQPQQRSGQQPYPPQQRQYPPQQRPAQQRQPQQRSGQQPYPPQQRQYPPQQRPAQQRQPQQRSGQQPYPPQQRQYPPQQRPAQQPYPPQRRSGQQPYPPQQRQPARPYPDQDGYYPPRQGRPEYRQVAVEPEDYRPRRRGIQRQNIPLIVLVVVLIGGVLFAGGKLGSMLLNYHRDRSAYNALADAATSGLAEPNATTEPGATPDPTNQQAASEAPFAVDWDYLKTTNPDVIGWLFCADTNINYPVVQTSDNDFYLHRGFDKQPNTAGALFADYNAALGVIHSNFIVYGHNMKDGSMFATVEKYLDPNFYTQHPYMYLMTPTQNYRIDLIAAHIVESTLNNYPGFFTGDGEYQQYLNEITSHSSFYTQSTVDAGYQLITMSTCDYSGSYTDPRCLLQGMLVPIT